MIYWELCKTFDHMNKEYMHNQESIKENKTHKILWDFEIKTNNLISAGRLDQLIVKKKKKKREPAK